MKLQYYV